MILSTILVAFIVFLTTMVPGFLLSLALLRKTGLNIYEIGIIGFIFGLVAAPILTWLEAYLMNSIHFFSFSLALYLINVLILTIVGAILCFWQGAFKNFKAEYLPKKGDMAQPHTERKAYWWVWAVLILLMLTVFINRMQSIGIAPNFFEFDPYFDMIDTNYIITYGQELLLDPSAWPSIPAGTNHRVEPIVPYMEAYWYDLSNALGPNFTTINTAMMSDISSIYPPIAAALLVFVIFMLIYHEYDEYIALIGAGLAATMPVLITTFIAGEQLVESWGIFAIFFFLAAYMLAVKNPKSVRLAIFAGVAFAINFLGAHYYTVTVGVFALYIIAQGIVSAIRGDLTKDFYKMNITVLIVITIFFALFLPYSSTLQNRVPGILGIPIIISGPLIALILVAILDYGPKFLKKMKLQENTMLIRAAWVIFILMMGALAVLFTPLGAPIHGYIALSTKFTTPSSPLFMTVEEYAPTGFGYNFDAAGFGTIAAEIAGAPVLLWIIFFASLILVLYSILFRNSKTGVLYLAISLLALAGFSEVKYLPHFGVAYIVLFCVLIGELVFIAGNSFKLRPATKPVATAEQQGELLTVPERTNKHYIYIIMGVALFLVSSVLGLVYFLYLALNKKKTYAVSNVKQYFWGAFVLLLLLTGAASVAGRSVYWGESGSYLDSFGAMLTAATTPPSQLCNTLSNGGYAIGTSLYCNTIPQYWLSAMAWIKSNVGPNAPRVLAWWDYGDWINWFGNSNAVLRGDNANATEDYATAAQYVLGASEGFTPQRLASFMNGNQSKYVLMDQDLIQKWSALNFLACVRVNATSRQFAIAQGQAQNPPQGFVLGQSQCEQQHSPQFVLVPLPPLLQNSSAYQQNINFYCQISNSTTQYIQAYLSPVNNITNQSTVCINPTPNTRGVLQVYTTNGVKMNAYIQSTNYEGFQSVQGVPFIEYLMIYSANGPNGTITDAPTLFYDSNYYRGFMLGSLPGFTQVYPTLPANSSGLNFVNVTEPIRIYALNNYTGGNAPVPPKPSWIINNYTIP